MYNQVKKSLIFRKFFTIVLIKQLTLCFIFALLIMLALSTQYAKAGEFDLFVLEASGEVKGYQMVAGTLNEFSYDEGSMHIVGNPRAIAIVRDIGLPGDQQYLCVASDAGLHVFSDDGSGSFDFQNTFSGDLNPVDPVDLVVGQDGNLLYVLEASGEVKGYQMVAGTLNEFSYDEGSMHIVGNPRAIAIVRDIGLPGDQQYLCVASDAGLHVFSDDGSGSFDFQNTFSGDLNPVDPVDLVVGLKVVETQSVIGADKVAFRAMDYRLTIPFKPEPDLWQLHLTCPDDCVGYFMFQARIDNLSNKTLSNLEVRVDTLTNDNLLILARGKRMGEDTVGAGTVEEGGRWILPTKHCPHYGDGKLGPGEFDIFTFHLCLKSFERFSFYVDLLGTVR